MFKVITFIFLSLFAAISYGWHSTQILPVRYNDNRVTETQVNALNPQVTNPRAVDSSNTKFANTVTGKVVFTETEFNAALLAGLEADQNGRILLSVSDGINAILHDENIELSAIINLDKVEQIDANAREIVENINSVFPFLDGSNVSVSVYGEPVARNGELGIKDNFTAKIGFIPLPNSVLKQLGVDVTQANYESVKIELLQINSVNLSKGVISFGVTPNGN